MPAVNRSFRTLDPVADRGAVADLLDRARDYYLLWLGRPPGPAEVDAVFTAGPPGCDPAESDRLGLFLDDDLCGVVELSFGFPEAGDAYLGLMILAPEVRAAGHGAAFHDLVLSRARQRGCARIFLAVLDSNTRGRAFWERMGYRPTGVTRRDDDTGHLLHRLVRTLVP